MDNHAFYKHSGKAPISGILLTLIGGLVAAVILGALYGAIIFWCPLIYINFFITLGFGVILGMLIGKLAKIGKIRNNKLLFILSLVLVLVALYVHWVVWVKLATEVVVLEPGALKSTLSLIASFGAWSIFGWTPSGGALWTIWIIEMLMVIAMGTAVAVGATAIPFCEDTNQWSVETALTRIFHPIESVENIKFPHDLLSKLIPQNEKTDAYCQLTVATVEDSSLRCVTVNNVTVEIDDGEEKLITEPVLENMLFDLGSYAKLQDLINSPSA